MFHSSIIDIIVFKAVVDAQNSEKLTLGGYTDFTSLHFTLKHENGNALKFKINRAGGQLGAAEYLLSHFSAHTQEILKVF